VERNRQEKKNKPRTNPYRLPNASVHLSKKNKELHATSLWRIMKVKESFSW